jgi:hypothetical protein
MEVKVQCLQAAQADGSELRALLAVQDCPDLPTTLKTLVHQFGWLS